MEESAGGFVDGRWPGTPTNPLGHERTASCDARFGLPKRVADANGRVVRTTCDAFGRETAPTTPDGVEIATTREWCGDSTATCASVRGVSPAYRERTTSPIGPTRNRYFDKLGRLLREEVQSFAGRASRTRRRAVSPRRRRPPGACADSSSKPHRRATYDDLGRPTAETRADGGSTTWNCHAVAAGGRVRVKRAETVEAADGTDATTPYEIRDYDLAGRLARLVEGDTDDDPGTLATGVATEYVWYGSGLSKSATVDGRCATGFRYDAAGNRTRTTNPNFSAVTSRGTLAAPDFVETYRYGSDARLESVATTIRAGGLVRNYSRSYARDANGRLLTESLSLRSDGRTGIQRARVPVETEERRRRVQPGDLRGGRRPGTAHERALRQRDDPDPNVRRRIGGGWRASRRSAARRRSATTRTGGGATVCWRAAPTKPARRSAGRRSRTTGWGGRRRRRRRCPGGGSRTLSMGYDELGALKSRSSSATGDLDVSVTALGSGSAAPGPTAARTVVVGAATHALSYDTGGRVTRDDDRSPGGVDRYFDWNARGLLEKVVVGDSLTAATPEAAEEYAYGPDGERYYRKSTRKDDSDPDDVAYPVEHRFYLGAFEERVEGETALPKTSVQTARVAGAILHTRTTTVAADPQDPENETTTRTASMRYLHRDHLGSARPATDASGSAVATASYDPYGGRRLDDGSRESNATELETAAADRTLDGARGFTGHEQLDRVGLVHMGGRVYDPRLGRFPSPDPVIGDPGRSQSWNLYAYAGNNPTSFTDPTGLFRSPMPWEDHSCARSLDCMHFDGGGGGFGPTSRRIASRRFDVFSVWRTYFVSTRRFERGLEGWRRFVGYKIVTVGHLSARLTRTSSAVSVPGDQQPSDRPMKLGVPGYFPGSFRIYYPDVEREGEHHFIIRGFVCRGESNPHCDEEWADKVFEYINQHDIPFYNGTNVGDGPRMLYGGNPIYHREYPDERRSENETLEGHLFHSLGHKNTVVHEVRFENGDLFYNVEGRGINAHPRLNNVIGSQRFAFTVWHVVLRYKNPSNTEVLFEPFYP